MHKKSAKLCRSGRWVELGSISRVDFGAPSDLGRRVWPIPGAPLRYTPGFYAARLQRLK